LYLTTFQEIILFIVTLKQESLMLMFFWSLQLTRKWEACMMQE